MHNELREQGLEVLAFPCNQFGYQEPRGAESAEVEDTLRPLSPVMDNAPPSAALQSELRCRAHRGGIWLFLTLRDGGSR